MKIGLDIMGGDYAPDSTVVGAIQALSELEEDDKIVLIGDETKIKEILEKEGQDHDAFDIVHASEVIEMEEHPARAFSRKPNSSIAIGFAMLRSGKLDAFSSAGNSGAMLVGSMHIVRSVPGVIRPMIASDLPKEDGGNGIILDVGINADCKPDVLYQFAVVGSLYAEHVLGIKNPKVALLNIGEEKEKGNLLTQATYRLMDETNEFNFVGNVEGRDLFDNSADVVVCDGFTGNVVLKEAEAFFKLISKRGLVDDYFSRFNYENYGGTPVLGVNANVLIGHGISSPKAIKNMILASKTVTLANLPSKIKEAFN
ncbi:MAG TPA: phosphate acyltransferase PlsX [Flavobacteriales bacterium]|nr:phosphate acyltransferase PlsX [Crocinitomicaceae bacterium]HAE32132.1 phosphate acyltransferase PlsX [Flavobacteriales bacterium]